MVHEVIRDDRVLLRPTGEADLDLLASWFSEPGVYEFWGGAALAEAEVDEKYVGRRSPHVECFVIEAHGEPVGFIQYHDPDDGGEGGGLDMVVLPAHRRKGLGRAAVETITNHLREGRSWKRITVDPDESNPIGVAFWAATGFVPERLVDDDPSRPPYWLMSLGDVREQRTWG
jgi:RimJ/RimL family protein N-acetyltransferase